MKRLRQAVRGLTGPILRRAYARFEELAFQASVRAIRETRWIAHDSALAAVNRALEEGRLVSQQSTLSAMNQALAAYQPPTPWVDEVTQVLDAVIAEQFRLQSQVEDLERLLREATAERAVLAGD